jgi:hypothetical protein
MALDDFFGSFNDFTGIPAGGDSFHDFTGVPEPITFNDFNPSSWEDDYAKMIGISPNSDPSLASPSNAEILKSINADKSGLLRKLFVDENGNLNLKTLAGIGGGLAGLLGANSPNRQKSGYQGSIPKYDAVRNMVTAPPTRAEGYRPGQGGVNYGGDVSYVPKGTAGSAGGGSGGGGAGGSSVGGFGGSSGLSDLAKLAGVGGLGYLANNILSGSSANKQPVKSNDPFYQSAEYKAFLNDSANREQTMDMYNSPYFGSVSSGSVGRDMDRAYEQYLNNTRANPASDGNPGSPANNNASWSDMTPAQQASFYAANPPFSSLTQGLQGLWGMTTFGRAQAALDPSRVSQESMIGKGVDPALAGLLAERNDAAMVDAANQSAINAINSEAGQTVASDAAAAAAAAAGIAAANGVGESGMGGATAGGDGGPSGDGTGGEARGGLIKGYAMGGLMGLAKGRYLQGETDGMADKIPAQIGQDQPAALSHGEFVVPADVVSHLGNGNSDAGAKKLYQMMDKIRTARTGNKKQGKRINPDKFMPGGLASAYAAGGEVKKFAGETGSSVSGLGTAANAGVTGSETAPNTFAGEYIADMLGKGQALANAPYQQYMGPLTAGESGLQSKVFGGLQNLNFPGNLGASFSSAGAYPPPAMDMGAYQQQPIGIGAQPGATTSFQPSPAGGIQQPQGIASQYMNPYLQNVLQPQMEELRRQAQINNLSGLGALTKSGAFGGGRQAIMESEAGRNLLQEQNKTIGAGYSNAFDRAMSQFNTEQARDLGLAKFMSDQGTTQRGIEAEGIAADKAAFEAARENPYKMVQYQQSLLQGMPISATNIDMATPSKLQEILSGIGGGIKMVGNNPSNVSLKDVTDLLGNLGLKTGG